MIPKAIHYCWFGRNPLPKLALKCIASWRKFFPDYEIKEWNEDNFDVNIIPYTSEAYAAKKYAFVSDYARFWILYHYGGIYFDTDVEVIRPMDDIIAKGPFMGIEVPGLEDKYPQINPGLGLGAEQGMPFYSGMMSLYDGLAFINDDGSHNTQTVVKYTTEILVRAGLAKSDSEQTLEGITIYPADFFNPMDSLTGKTVLSQNTRSIHLYMNSWSDKSSLYKWLSRLSHRLFGLFFHRVKSVIIEA